MACVKYCPRCDNNTIVSNTRKKDYDKGLLTRFRTCTECGYRYKTVEITVEEYASLKEKAKE